MLIIFAAHLGGFLMGLLVGTIFYPVICTTRRQRLLMYGIRIAMVPIVIILYVLLVRNFYTSDPYAGMWLPFVLSRCCLTLVQRARVVDTYLAYQPVPITIARGK